MNIEQIDKKLEAIQNKIKYKAFGKTKPATERAKKRRLVNKAKPAQGLDDEEERARSLLQEQSQLLANKINEIKEQRHGRVSNVFKMREEVSGGKKQSQEPHAVLDPKTKQTVFSAEEIKRVNLEHCVNVLSNNAPNPKVVALLNLESEVHDLMMEDTTDQETNITEDDFKETIAKLKKKNKKSYYFLIRAGKQFQDVIFKLCRRMIKEECFLNRIFLTTLYQLWKHKGSRQDLSTYRYLHIKDWLPKVTECLTVRLMKDDILQSGNKYQIGGIPGHRVEEHLIVFKSIIQLHMSREGGVIAELVDFEKFFDKEILRTLMTSLNKANVNKKRYRCWFKLNEKCVISVATPAGLTKTAETFEIVPQGSGGAALASGHDIALGLETYFSNSMDEITYGSVRINPLAYQDDVNRLAKDVT